MRRRAQRRRSCPAACTTLRAGSGVAWRRLSWGGTSTQSPGNSGRKVWSAVWPVACRCLLREGTPGTKQVAGLSRSGTAREPNAAACSGAPPQRRTLRRIPHLRCSGGSASRSSSSRRRAPFGWRIAGWPSARDVSRERFYNYLGWLQKSALRTWSAAARRRRRGAAALCRPGASMAPLSRFKDKLAGECCWPSPLP